MISFFQLVRAHWLLCAAVGMAVWYPLVLFWYCRRSDGAFAAWQDEDFRALSREDLAEEAILGEAAEEYGVRVLGSDELLFLRDFIRDRDDEELQGLIPDLLEELKAVVKAAVGDEVPREELLGMLRPVAERYPQVRDSRHWAAVAVWIRENMPLVLDEEEIWDLWV